MALPQNPLTRIQVRGFRSIREADLEIGPLNVLVGANGAGKSNFISLFTLIHCLAQRELASYVASHGGMNDILYYGLKTTSTLYLKLYLQPNEYECELSADPSGQAYFKFERGSYHDYNANFEMGSGHTESNLTSYKDNSRYVNIRKAIANSMVSWKKYHFHDTGTSARVKQWGNIDNNRELAFDGANLAAYLHRLRSYKDTAVYYHNIVSAIKVMAPYFSDFVINGRSTSTGDQVLLTWRQKNDDRILGPHMFSDGTLRYICMTTLLLGPDTPSVVVLDEPELGLHPRAIALLSEMLRSASAQSRVIVATQSVPLVDQFEPEEVIVVTRREDSTLYERLDSASLSEWLQEYTLGDLLEKNVLEIGF
jgi:predicted ATPase